MFQLQLFFLLHCDEWDRVVALPRHKFVTGATLLQLQRTQLKATRLTSASFFYVCCCHHACRCRSFKGFVSKNSVRIYDKFWMKTKQQNCYKKFKSSTYDDSVILNLRRKSEGRIHSFNCIDH